MIRSIYALLRIFAGIDRPIDNSIQIDGWYAPIISLVYILIVDITPITSQLTSMLIIEVENKIDRDSSSINFYSSGDNDIVLNKNIHPILIKSSPKSQTFDFNRSESKAEIMINNSQVQNIRIRSISDVSRNTN